MRRILLSALGAIVLSAPLAHAGRRIERRALPAGAAAASATPLGRHGGDPALEAAIDRLRASVATPATATATVPPSAEAYLGRSPGGYLTTFAAPSGRTSRVKQTVGGTGPEGTALAFLRAHRAAFGWSAKGVSLQAVRSLGREGRTFVRFEQRFAGLPVFGASAVVQVERDGGISFALVDIARDDAEMREPGFATEPSVTTASATAAAMEVLPAGERSGLAVGEPELMIYEPSVIGSAGPSELVWNVRVTNTGGDVNQVVLVDAVSGDVAFTYSDVKESKVRQIYDANNVRGSLGTLARAEGAPATGIADVDLAYEYFGDTYDFYFTRLGRDSYDGAGATLVARVRYCETSVLSPCPYTNAYWNGSEMRFGQGYAAADDVVAHELTHGVTERESNLIYWGESGAINESLSDIFGEFVDLTNTGGTDTPAVRWEIGEDLPGGAIRSMSDPTLYGDPDRRFSSSWYVGSEDNRGVHVNSGVGNKLAYLLTDGGTFNGETVAAVGISDVAKLFYEANASLLVPASDYFDLYAVLRQAARNLAWTPAAREALERACRAVQIDLPSNPTTILSDGFEGSFPGAWQIYDQGGPPPGSGIGTQWGRSTYRKAGGSASAWCAAGGSSPSPGGGPYKPLMDTWMVVGPFSLTGATNAWAEFDTFLDVEPGFDEIFWGVSTDGVNFDGYPVSPLPDGYSVGETTVPGFSHEVFSFKEIPGIVGQPQVWLAFEFWSDDIVEYEGAYVDNVVIKKNPTQAPFGSFDTPADGTTGITGAIAVTGWALDDVAVSNVQIYRDPISGEPTQPNGKVYIGDATFVPGARPDVDAAYANYPFSYKAGWGYMLLTNFFPPSSGNGTYRLHAYAYDGEGQSRLLGSKTVTLTNATATKPFGTLDTPGQGDTVSGTIVVFGWALTPQPGMIPIDGSTIWLTIDNNYIGHPTYNQYRSDIAGAFPGYANSNGAVGFSVVDTTLLANGMHTIGWLVTDDLGRAEGLGSRFFWVQN